jgi:hypothetical protein
MFTLALLTAFAINIPQGEVVPAKRFDWNEFRYMRKACDGYHQ